MTDSPIAADDPFDSLQAITQAVGENLVAAMDGMRPGFEQLAECFLDLGVKLRAAGLIPDTRRTTKTERREAKRDLALRRRTGGPEMGVAACARLRRVHLASGGTVLDTGPLVTAASAFEPCAIGIPAVDHEEARA
jgi:protein-disulfide isomerase-like protein with CxxC motif